MCGGEQRLTLAAQVWILLACLRVLRYSEKVEAWKAENVAQEFSAKRAESQALE